MNKPIKKYPFKQGLDLEFEIVDLKKVLEQKHNMMTVPHRAQFYHIIWLSKGKGNHFVDFVPVELEDDMILFIANNSVNVFDKEGCYEGKAIIFTDGFFGKNKQDFQFLRSSRLFSDLYKLAKIKVSTKVSELKYQLKLMEEEYQREQDAEHYPILHNMLHVFLLMAERVLRQQGHGDLKPGVNLDHIVLFKDLLEDNFIENKSVKFYAYELGISEKQLLKACSGLLDKTPKQIINERVLLEAKRLLAHSNQSIKEIAYALGYAEPTNFIKYFKKHTACTPAEFREQILEKEKG